MRLCVSTLVRLCALVGCISLIFMLLCAADSQIITSSSHQVINRPESWYQQRAAYQLKGIREVVVDHGRVDVLTVTHAIEVERLEKFKEGIGQALWYSWQTKRAPGLVLIVPAPTDATDHAAVRAKDFSPLQWRGIRDQITNHTSIKVWVQSASDGHVAE